MTNILSKITSIWREKYFSTNDVGLNIFDAVAGEISWLEESPGILNVESGIWPANTFRPKMKKYKTNFV